MEKKSPESKVNQHSVIKEVINKLFASLHKAYGKETKIILNDLGGYDFRDRESNEYIPNFQDYPGNFFKSDEIDKTPIFIEVIDFLLNTRKPQCVLMAFAAASSDLFKDDMKKV